LVIGGIFVILMLLKFTLEDDGYSPTPQERAAAEKINMNGPMKGMMEAMSHVYPPSMNPAKLPEPDGAGAELYKTFCVRCHGLINPAMRTPEEWREISADMFKRTDKLYNTMGMLLLMKLPTTRERKAIVDYLTSHALKAADTKALPEPDSAGAVLFSVRCSQCHTLPDTGFHKAAEWRGVVDRMRSNMRAMRKPVISDDEAGKISAYLEKHS